MARAEVEARQAPGHASKQRDADRRCTRHEELCSRETGRDQDDGDSEATSGQRAVLRGDRKGDQLNRHTNRAITTSRGARIGRDLPIIRPYHPWMDTAEDDFLQFVTQAVEDAVTFDGDAATMASRAREGDKDAVTELTRAYATIGVLSGIRLRPSWLPRLIQEGPTAIAVELPAAIEATFAGFREPPFPFEEAP